MSRLDKGGIVDALVAKLGAKPDPDGIADLVAPQGRIGVAATAAEIKPTIDRLRPLEGYRWLAINSGDLFTASPVTIGTKIGILDATGRTLKAADVPRKK